MTELGGIGRVAPAQPVTRTAQATSGAAFAVAAESDAAPAVVSALNGPAALAGLLALQEAEATPVRDRAARRRGRDILGALTGLQRALLGDEDSAAATGRLSALLAHVPLAEDPQLNGILAAIRLRARIELARRQERP